MRLINADVLIAWTDNYYDSEKFTVGHFANMVKDMPTIEERKTGKWIYGESEIGNDGYYCSVCGNFVPWKYGEYDIDFIQEFLFCNKCGAKMEEGEQNG